MELTSRVDFLASSGDTDDNTLTPTLVAGLQRSTHDTNATRAVEGVVATTISHLNELILDRLAIELRRVDEVSAAEFLTPLLLRIIDIDDNDLASALLDSTLDDRETNAAGSEDSNIGALLDLGSHDSSTVTGRDTAAEQTRAVHRRLVGDGDNGDIGDDSVLREC